MTKDARHDDILHRALRTFGRTNYHVATTKSVAHDAGISEALLFQHFENKEALFLESLSKAAEKLNRELDQIIGQNLIDPLHALIRAYTYFSNFLLQYPEYGRATLAALSEAHNHKFRALMTSHVERTEALLMKGIERGIESGTFRTDLNADLVRWIFVSGYHYMIIANQLGRLPALNPELMRAILQPILHQPTSTSPALALRRGGIVESPLLCKEGDGGGRDQRRKP